MSQFQNAPFCPISASGKNINPRNIKYIHVVNPAMAGSPFLTPNPAESGKHLETGSKAK